MRGKTVEMMQKVKDLLIENTYMTAEALAEKCNMSTTSIYRIIKLLRQENIGVHVTPNGYVMSEYAQLHDDTHFIRRLQGRRVSDYMAISAAAPHIKKRWKGLESAKNMGVILAPLMPDMQLLESGLEVVKALEVREGIGVV